MEAQQEVPREYRKYLMEPSEAFVASIASMKLRPDRLTVIPTICGVKKEIGEVILHPKKKFDPHIGELKPYHKQLRPRTLDDLKEWAGVPNRVLERAGRPVAPREVRMHHLPAQEEFAFKELEPERRLAVRDTAFNLLYGYAHPERVARPPYAGVVRWMLEKANLPVFAARDLIVCPDETVQFQSFAVLIFNNVIVVGNGRIRVGSNVKLFATQVRHV